MPRPIRQGTKCASRRLTILFFCGRKPEAYDPMQGGGLRSYASGRKPGAYDPMQAGGLQS